MLWTLMGAGEGRRHCYDQCVEYLYWEWGICSWPVSIPCCRTDVLLVGAGCVSASESWHPEPLPTRPATPTYQHYINSPLLQIITVHLSPNITHNTEANHSSHFIVLIREEHWQDQLILLSYNTTNYQCLSHVNIKHRATICYRQNHFPYSK